MVGGAAAMAQLADNPADNPKERRLDQQVDQAIEAGKKALLTRQHDDGSWHGFEEGAGGVEGMTGVSTQPMKMDVMFPVGPTALAVYALLEAGESPKSKPIHLVLDWLAKTSLKKTYDIGLRCNAWVSASTDDAVLYRKLLDKDAKALLGSTSDGGYGYDIGVMANYPDNSNSQYGLLGVWARRADRLRGAGGVLDQGPQILGGLSEWRRRLGLSQGRQVRLDGHDDRGRPGQPVRLL